MITSKVIYEVPILDKQISLFKYFLDIDGKFRNSLYIEYPQLKSEDTNSAVNTIYENRKEELKNKKDSAQEGWNNIERYVLKEFTNILHKEWDIETIPGGISLLPFSTRDLKEKRFDVYYKKDIQSILKTTTHELFHFIFFDKWKDIFPNTTIEEMDYPNPVWGVSEIVLPIMLNSSKVADILGMKFSTYTMFENEVLEEENIVEHIEGLYRNNNLENFLKQSDEYIRTYYEWKNRNRV